MTDRSAQELSTQLHVDVMYSINNQLFLLYIIHQGEVHPNCIRLICDFHTFQALDRWANCSQHGIPPEVRSIVKAAFKELVYAKSGQ